MDSAAAVCCVVVYSIVFFACLDEKGQETMYKELMQAMAGKIYTAIMCSRCRADKYILFPDSNSAYLKWGIQLLPQYMLQNKSERIVVVAADDLVKQEIAKSGIADIRFKKVSRYSMDCVLSFYAIEDLSDRWIVVSTKRPYDTGAERLLGVKGITFRDIIYYDIYKLDGELT